MHVAAALGTPVVVPFGKPRRRELTGPGLPGRCATSIAAGERFRALPVFYGMSIDFRCMKGLGWRRWWGRF